MSEKSQTIRDFINCFPTIPDFAEILGHQQMFVPDLRYRYSPVTDAISTVFVTGMWGTEAKQFRGLVTS